MPNTHGDIDLTALSKASGIDYNVIDNGGECVVDGVKVIVGGTDVLGMWLRDAFGRRVIFKTRNRKQAQDVVDKIYGKGKYHVSSSYI